MNSVMLASLRFCRVVHSASDQTDLKATLGGLAVDVIVSAGLSGINGVTYA